MFKRWHDCPAIACPVTGEVIVVFYNNARGYQECIALLRDIQQEMKRCGL